MAVAYGHAASASGIGTSLSFAHDATGDNILLVAFAVRDDTGTATVTATYNGVSMTSAGLKRHTISDLDLYTFYLANPSSGSNTVSVGSATTASNLVGLSISLSGSAGTIGTVDIQEFLIGITDFSVNATLGANDMLVGFGTVFGGLGALAVTVGTERVEKTDGDNHVASGLTNTGTGSTPGTWSRSSSPAVAIGIPVNVATGGGAVAVVPTLLTLGVG